MTREQLAQAHTTAITRHWRELVDSGGRPTQALLDDLAGIAEDHAAGSKPAAARKRAR